MDTSVVVAVITSAGAIAAAAVGREWHVRRKTSAGTRSDNVLIGHSNSNTQRRVYFKGDEYRFLNFGGKNSRIEPLGGGPSFLAPTHELFHDSAQHRRVSRDSVVVRA